MTGTMMAPVALLAAAAPVGDPQAEIVAALAASAAGWNAGSVARFMAVYAEDATFVSGGSVKRGKAEIAKGYAASFARRSEKRGVLSLVPVSWRAVGERHMLLVARWTLTPAGAKPESGMTTLLFERQTAGWRILADHSS